MDLSHLVTFNLALIAAILSPGPAFLYSLQTTLTQGRAAGLITGLGLSTMAATWTLLALLGLDGLFVLFPWAYLLFKVLGALYLLHLAWKTWRGAANPLGVTEKPRAAAFTGGLLVNLANPKSMLFAAALIVVVFPMELSGLHKAIIVGNQFLMEVIAYSTFAVLASTKSVSARYLRAKSTFDRLSAIVLGALGIRLLLDQRH